MRLDALTLALALAATPALGAQESVRVLDATQGCFHSDVRRYEWTARGDVFARGERELPRATIAAIRATVLACKGEPPDLLARVGITPESIAAKRERAARTALPEAFQSAFQGAGSELELVPAELRRLFDYEHLAPYIRAELLSTNWESTTSMELEVVLPGEPPVTVASRGRVPWMLPWTVTVGDERREVADVAISRALAPLLDPDGPCAALLDGTRYWAEGFWEDASFWRRFVGVQLDAALSAERYVRLPGYARFSARFQVDHELTGNVNLQSLSLYVTLGARKPSVIDEARWWSPIADGAPSATWDDFLGAYDAATAALARQRWLVDWKLAGPRRTIGIDVVGARGHSEHRLDLFVEPIWRDAGFAGAPEFQLLLRRERKWCATVYLASAEPGALICSAKPGEGEHWLDGLDFSYHPRDKVPTYARVDSQGRHEVRTLESAR